MRREDKLILSHRPYAVALDSLVTTPGLAANTVHCHVKAVWFRRRRGVTVACVGYLWDFQSTATVTVGDFLRSADDGRYGGTCQGRWDGTGYWGAEDPETVATHLELLRPMLANYPAVPAAFDGWWTHHVLTATGGGPHA